METIAHSDPLEREINSGRRNPEALLRQLDQELLPGLIGRDLTALRQLTVDRPVDRITSQSRPPAATTDPGRAGSSPIPRQRIHPARRLLEVPPTVRSPFPPYWTAGRPELLPQARACREKTDWQWPPPPALLHQGPTLDPDRNPALRQLEAGRLLFPAPGGPTDYWHNTGLELRPDPEPKSARGPEPTAYLLWDQDSGQVLSRFRLGKETGRYAGWNWNHYDSRNQLAGMAQSPEMLWEQACAGTVATAALLCSRRPLNRLQLLNYCQEEIIPLRGLELTPPADPAAASLRGGYDYRELRRLQDGRVLWEFTRKENSLSEYNLRKQTDRWLCARPDERQPHYIADTFEAAVARLLVESLAADETAGSHLPTRL